MLVPQYNYGINDLFRPIGDFEIKNLQIFNRWGELIFEKSNSDIYWDGTYRG